MKRGELYLLPSLLGESDPDRVLPAYNIQIIRSLRHFIVEEEKSARHFIKLVSPDTVIRECEFFPLNEHTSDKDIKDYLLPAENGINMGLISEAGCPCVADPGSAIVSLARKKEIVIHPLVGPSSIILALMASGFSGQRFTFHGYLPAKPDERRKRISEIERQSSSNNETQIFIETPYRNDQLIEDIVRICGDQTHFCLAVNVTAADETIISKPIREWKNSQYLPGKKPAIFLLYNGSRSV